MKAFGNALTHSQQVLQNQFWRLSQDKYLVYSPGDALTAESAKAVIPTGSELFLLAPNSMHNLGLKVWDDVFANTTIVAAEAAHARLKKKAFVEAEDLKQLMSYLPEHIRLEQLPKNKIGEVWLDIQLKADRIWVVCDAIFNFDSLPGGLMGLLMKLNRMGPGIEISRIYQFLGLKDKRAYGDWLLDLVNTYKPTVLIPLHGKPYTDNDLIDVLKKHTELRLLAK